MSQAATSWQPAAAANWPAETPAMTGIGNLKIRLLYELDFTYIHATLCGVRSVVIQYKSLSTLSDKARNRLKAG